MRSPGAGFTLALTLALAACGGEGSDGSGAGAWAEGEGWRLDREPTLEIGAVDAPPAYQLTRVVGAIRLGDGRVVVADAGSNDLRFFDSTGRHLRTVGRKGGGPGEFSALAGIFRLPGDSIAAFDGFGRLSRFDPKGVFQHSVSIPALEGGVPLQIDGILADGSLVAHPAYNPVFQPGSEVVRDTIAYLHLAADGTVLNELGRFPGAEALTLAGRENGGWAARAVVPYGATTLHATSGDRVYIGDSSTFEIAVLDPAGVHVRRIRAAYPPERLTAGEIDRYRAEALRQARNGPFKQIRQRELEVLPFPELKSAYAALLADAGSNLWVQHHPPVDEPSTRWSVFDAEGTLLGLVLGPPAFRATEIGEDYLLGVLVDELGIEHVRLFGLDRTP